MRPRYASRGPPPQGMRPMGMPNGMRPPMRGRGGPSGPFYRGMHRPPPYPGMRPPPMYGPPMGMGPGPMMPRMRPPPPHMIPPPMMRPGPRPMLGRPIKKPQKNFNLNNDGKVKKKKLKFRSFYVTRPWVTDELRGEIAKKDELFKQAKNSNTADDWNLFKEQKDKCVHMYSALKMEYIGQHPEEVFSESDPDDSDQQYICESCDREFDYEDAYQAHMNEHQTCGIDGCKFNAHELLVMTHIKVQHSSGLYDKIRNISTPEDIEKWRLERKKNYPSKANIEIRYKMQEEMLKRGERIKPNKERFLKKNGKVMKQRKKKGKKKIVVKKEVAVSLIDEKADWNGTMFPFKGTKAFEEKSDEEEDFSDDEWSPNVSGNVEMPRLNNALGALMSAYISDEDDDENVKKKIKKEENFVVDIKQEANDEGEKCSKDDEVVEEKILKVPVDVPDKASEDKVLNETKKRAKENEVTEDMPIPAKKIRNKKPAPLATKRTFSRRPTLLQKLLDKEIRHERNVILQCVRYIINNNFFDETSNNTD